MSAEFGGARDLFLSTLQIQNFRGIRNLRLELDDVCVLIGENNAGKSTVLDALRICLTRSFTRKSAVFDEYDYFLDGSTADPKNAPPIILTMTFEEREEDEWPDEISQRLDAAIQVSGLIRSLALQIKSGFDVATGDFTTDYEFLDLAGNTLTKAKNPRILINLQQLVPTFYLASLRDAAQEFRAKSQFWGPFVRSLGLDDAAKLEIETALAELNKKVLAGHAAFETIKTHLKKAAELIPLGVEPVHIEAMPSRAFDILAKTQVSLSSTSGARIPITRHGNGTQSLAVICLFDAFLTARLSSAYGEFAEPLLALEEPESHLHPSASKAVGELLQSLSGQKVITTHSGDLLAGVPLTKLRRLRRKGNNICVFQLKSGILDADEIAKLDYQIRATRGSLLFSRCWLLVEGETEGTFFAECARTYGYDLYAEGISCLEYSQVGVEKFIKLADSLGVEWFVVSDNDLEGLKYAKVAESHLKGRPKQKHLQVLEHGDMEVFLCMAGFGAIYEAGVASHKAKNITSPKGTLEFWQQVTDAQSKNAKPRNVLAVAQQIAKQGKESVPALLASIIDRARTLAQECV